MSPPYPEIPDTSIQPGNRVRSYDFRGVNDCYVEGIVVRFTDHMEGCPRYEIDVDRRVFGGKEIPVAEDEKKVYPPINNTPNWLGGKTCGVVKIEDQPQLANTTKIRPR